MFSPHRSFQCILGILSLAVFSGAEEETSYNSAKEKGRTLEVPSLPHLSLDLASRHLDIDATVCLAEGMLELMACTEDSKEHESIVAVKALPKHIHLMLTLLGAKSGHPPRREAIDETQTRWRDVPAKGHPIDAYLVFENDEGIAIERPIQEFLKNSEGEPFYTSTFVFAGSVIRQDEKGHGVYLADFSGHVMTLSSFGDEVLSQPKIYSHANDELAWEVNASELPEVGTDVVLRLRPQEPLHATPAQKRASELVPSR